MKKTWLAVVAIILASCGVTKVTATWDDVYKMIDSGEMQSQIDRTIYGIGPETHPASMVVLQFFDYFMTGNGAKAWEFVKPDSPYGKNIGSADKLTQSIEDAKKDTEYHSVTIKGISITKKDANGKRTARVSFILNVTDRVSMKQYDSAGTYYLLEKNGKWLINDIEKLREYK